MSDMLQVYYIYFNLLNGAGSQQEAGLNMVDCTNKLGYIILLTYGMLRGCGRNT